MMQLIEHLLFVKRQKSDSLTVQMQVKESRRDTRTLNSPKVHFKRAEISLCRGQRGFIATGRCLLVPRERLCNPTPLTELFV